MRWQKIARLAIASFVIVFAGAVFFIMRQRTAAPPDLPQEAAPVPVDAKLVNQGPLEYELTQNGKLRYRIVGKQHRVYADGRNTVEHVELTLPDRKGKTIVIKADEAELTQPAGKELGVAVFRKNVVLSTNDGLEVKTGSATYTDANGIITVPGAVEFKRGRMCGTGVGATYDNTKDVLWLLDQVRMTVAPEQPGKPASDITANTAGLARSDNYVKLITNARVVSEDRTIAADDLTAFLKPGGGDTIERAELRGNSVITETGPNPRHMAARDIDLGYAADGRTLERVRLMENGVVTLTATGDAPGRKISGRTIDMAMAPDGATLTALNAADNVVVDLPGQGDAPVRNIRAATLQASGAAPGEPLRTATFAGGVEYRETRAGPALSERSESKGRGAQSALDRTARSQRLIVTTKPGFGDIEQADFHGNFKFSDGKLSAEAPRGLYAMTADRIDLSPSAGDPGPTPFVNDGHSLVEARNIQVSPGSRKLTADTNVRSTLQPKRDEGGERGRSGRGIAPVAPPGEPPSRMPAMLKKDRPVYVASNRLSYDGVAEATYSGDARLWQDQSQSKIDADTIVLNDRTGNMTARTNVSTSMLLEEIDPNTKQKKVSLTTATSDLLVYEDAKRLAVYTGTKTEPANMKGPYGDVTSNRIDLYLKEGGEELERAEAHGAVTVKETLRTATGDVLVYTAADDTYTMTGNPVEAIEKDTPASTTCKRTLGSTLTFTRSVGSIRVQTSGLVPIKAEQIPCPAERRD
jgi:lipopolysaccharide export system protein LptA